MKTRGMKTRGFPHYHIVCTDGTHTRIPGYRDKTYAESITKKGQTVVRCECNAQIDSGFIRPTRPSRLHAT